MDGPPIPEAARGLCGRADHRRRARQRRCGDGIRRRRCRTWATSCSRRGLINAHTHLELSEMTPGPPPASFADWLISLMSRLRRRTRCSDASRTRGARRASSSAFASASRRSADITSSSHASTARPRASPLRAISYGEVRAMAPATRTARTPTGCGNRHRPAITDRLRSGISPHSPYTVEPRRHTALPEPRTAASWLTTHLAETPDEAAFPPRSLRPAATRVGLARRLGRRRRRRSTAARSASPRRGTARHVAASRPRQLLRRRRTAAARGREGERRLLPADARVLRTPAAPLAGDARPRHQRLRRARTAAQARPISTCSTTCGCCTESRRRCRRSRCGRWRLERRQAIGRFDAGAFSRRFVPIWWHFRFSRDARPAGSRVGVDALPEHV